MSNTTVKSVSFAAIDPFVERNMVLPTERKASNRDMVEWGERNIYPDYLQALYDSVPTLRSIINGNIDFIGGDDVTVMPFREGFKPGIVNEKGENVRDQVRKLAFDYEMMGGYALQINRNILGKVAEIYHVPMKFLRSNKENTVFYYCEDWGKAGRKDIIVYPSFMPTLDWAMMSDEERLRHASSIVYVKNTHTQVYPSPLYAAAIKSCEIERMVDDFHINALENQFVSSAIINFNNGIPSDEMKREIEKDVEEKFCGNSNSGRIMLSWNPNKESETSIVEFKVEDFGEKYKALAVHSRQQIFGAFRAIPLLFGLTSETNTGFSTDEFEQSFKLYNRTQIQPVQKSIADTYEKILGIPGALIIKPFSLAGETEDKVN